MAGDESAGFGAIDDSACLANEGQCCDDMQAVLTLRLAEAESRITGRGMDALNPVIHVGAATMP